MKRTYLFLLVSFLFGCGNSSVGNELIGQPKKLHHQTPIICPDRVDVDVSLGVMRNGVGSMSTQDLTLTVPQVADVAKLEEAIEAGKLVKLTYTERRLTFCEQAEAVTSVEIQ